MRTFNAGGLEDAVGELLETGAKRVTGYWGPEEVTSVTRLIRNGKINKRDSRVTIVVKIGAPNYKERKFIKTFMRTGEKFPAQRVQYPAKRKGLGVKA